MIKLKNVTNAKSVNEFYNTLYGHYLDEYDIEAVSQELTELVEGSRIYDIASNKHTSNKFVASGTESSQILKDTNNETPVKPRNGKITTQSDATALVGFIAFLVAFLLVQGGFFIAWWVNGFPIDGAVRAFMPAIVVVILYGVVTLCDFVLMLVRRIKGKGKVKK